MRVIIKIAKTEIHKLFYSPVAWFVLVVFAFQFSYLFSEHIELLLMNFGWKSDQVERITWNIYAHTRPPVGAYHGMLKYLHLYIPLITMNIMSRELSTGSIKLLYSSPVNNRQIVLGKVPRINGFRFCADCYSRCVCGLCVVHY